MTSLGQDPQASSEVRDACLLSGVEAAEICSKVLDWKIKNSILGEIVSHSYILFVEDLIVSID